MTKVVQLIPQRVESLNYKNKGAESKEFYFDGQHYTLCGNQTKAVRDEVANAWVAHDSDVRILNDR